MITTLTANPALDRVYQVPGVTLCGTHRVADMQVIPAGKGVNVARLLHRSGVPVTAAGFLAGHNGRRLLAGLDKLGVPHDFVWGEGETRLCLNLLDPEQDCHTEIIEPGPALGGADQRALLVQAERLAGMSEVLVIGGSPPPDTPSDFCARLIERARAAGARTVLDARGDWLREGVKAAPDLVKPNRQEFEDLMGDCRSLRVMAGRSRRWVVQQGVGRVMVSLGKEGALLVDENNTWLAHAPSVCTVSAVGSGDALLAGFLQGGWSGEETTEALCRGVAMAAANACHAGAAELALEEVDALRRQVRLERLIVDR